MMSVPSPAGNPSAAQPNSDKLSLHFFIFSCGQGDTILVRLPDDRWILIDCFLPKQFGIRDRFFKFLEEEKIKTFDFIFQTHPDYDHYHGMQAVIEHFLAKGESIGCYLDIGLDAKRVQHILNNGLFGKEYQSLQDKLGELFDSGSTRYFELTSSSAPLTPKGYKGKIDFIPIGPDPADKRRLTEGNLIKYRKNPTTKLETNELSLVIVLSARTAGKSFNVLLCADAGTEAIDHALEVWKHHAADYGIAAEFDAIKIPHHGSINSRTPNLCRMKRANLAMAVASADMRGPLPDREVLREFLQIGWSVMSTTSKRTKKRPSLPMTLANRGTDDEAEVFRNTIKISWDSENGMSAEPDGARIRAEDLDHYGTAVS